MASASNSTRHLRITQHIAYIILLVAVIPMVFPVLWMLATAVTPQHLFYEQDGLLFWPSEVRLRNFVDALTSLPFDRFFLNTALYSLTATLGTLVSCTLVAYGFARFRFRNRNLLFGVLLSTMLLPGIVLMVPTYLMFSYIGWIDTYHPLIVPSFFGLSATTVFILRQRIATIPNNVFEAGHIEGFNVYHALRFIILPEILPILGTFAVLHFLIHWNNLIGPLIYINSFDKKTLSLGLTYILRQFSARTTLLMAASLVTMIPTILLFFVNQKRIIRGMNLFDQAK